MTPLLRPEDQFHVGIVAEDFDATKDQLSRLFGFEWSGDMGGPTEVSLPTGDTVIDFRCTYSWSDDVAADTAELERHGYVTEATRKGPDGALFFAFLRSAGQTGFRVELVSRAARPFLERAWAR